MPLLTTLVGALPKRTYTPYAIGGGGYIFADAFGAEYDRLQQHRPLADVLAMQQFLAVLKQVQLDLDVAVDGELSRLVYWQYNCLDMAGIERDGDEVVVTGPLSPGPAMLVDDWRQAQSFTERPVKIATAGPATLSEYVVDRHYGDKRALCRAFAAALGTELGALAEAGCRWLQLDEPQLGFQPEMALAYGFEAVDACFAGLPTEVNRVLHICRGYAPVDGDREGRNPARPYARLAAAIEACAADVISLEDASEYHEDLRFLETLATTKVMFGAVSNLDTKVEPVEQIRERLKTALQHVDAERLIVAPDCGFGTYRDEDASFVWQKLANMVAAAKSL
jgi:5-methyltetrahydropteroyltriglutamate--homocysteine methyltransferase